MDHHTLGAVSACAFGLIHVDPVDQLPEERCSQRLHLHELPFSITENDHPVCVLLSPEQYEVMIEMLSDTFLLEEAESRMAVNDDAKDISQEEIMRTLGIRQEELDTIDVEICE